MATSSPSFMMFFIPLFPLPHDPHDEITHTRPSCDKAGLLSQEKVESWRAHG